MVVVAVRFSTGRMVRDNRGEGGASDWFIGNLYTPCLAQLLGNYQL